ncbi:patatin-like phospholipase family protein [Selenihalanaerobacter shriftii]|uniref:NTE family protein n=1 Tax=Selenihalanaerobacter shriftii TaxID=142842 RepID=A0A1T4MX43_9FIRM|nr:patatin-like phospholipase family protein [Selenihalanaerobacter shriftii]SJZ71426.1 NTE family protein [Selenihalanaerobacter shriftii]
MKLNKFNNYLILLLILILLTPKTFALSDSAKIIYQKVKMGNETYIIEDSKQFDKLDDPTIAIALGGGGARALVHIGVLKALQEENIPIDMVVGTSMGAIIGTLYGSGIPIKQIEKIATEVTFSKMFELNFPSTQSLLETKKVNYSLEKLAPNKRLEEFPIPTVLLSFDLNRGAKYVHTSGRISNVIQSSYAIPVYFPVHKKSAYNQEDFYLVDPGVVELTPAKTAKVLGADIIISSTAIDQLAYDKYNNPIRALSRMIQLLQKRNSAPIVNKYSDIIINNNVGNYSFMDFELADSLIKLGYSQTKKKIPEIKELLKQNNIALNKLERKQTLNISQTLKNIKYNRLMIDSYMTKPLIYFGKDNSLFKQELFKDELFKPQYGAKVTKEHIDFTVLNVDKDTDDLETSIRLKQVTPNIDLIGKGKINSEEDKMELTMKYYTNNYTIGFGRKKINHQDFNLLTNEYDLSTNNIKFQGETDLLISPDFDSYKVLTSHQTKFKLSSIWSIKPKIVYNNTDILSSPDIYRGIEPEETADFQATIDWVYTHDFLPALEFMKIIQVNDIQLYLFSDYLSSTRESTAYGLGAQMNLRLLGLKPLHLGVYSSRDKKYDESKLSWDLDLVF